MLRMFARRTFITRISTNTDKILFGLSLPSGSIVNDIKVRVSLVMEDLAGVVNLALAQVVAYACEGWLLPVLDPDSAANYDTLWDNLVPKDSDVETLDLDTGAVDTSSMYEPGEIDLSALFDVGLQPERIYHRHRICTSARNSLLTFQDAVTPFSPLWIAGDSFDIHLKKRYRVNQPTVLVFGVGLPLGDDTSATSPTILTEGQWPQVKYFRHVLERALLHTLGVIEAGAETPWEEATALIKTHLDPDVYETEDGAFAILVDWTAAGEAIIDHSVEGEMGIASVSTGR